LASEIQYLDLAPLGQEDVGGLDVAMDDAFGMGRIQRVGNLDAQFQHLIHFQSLALDAVLERLTFEQLHSDERLPVLLANVVNRTDVRVVQCGRGLGLALEAGQRLRVTSNVWRQELESDKTM